MIKLLYLAAGGAIGTVSRYLLSTLFSGQNTVSLFPWGTFCVNMAGSFIIGIVGALAIVNDSQTDSKIFIMAGLLGGFTTFSSLAFESVMLFRSGHAIAAITYVLTTNILGVLLAFLGYGIGNHLN